MKLVREFLEYKNGMNFERTGDPMADMRLGRKAQICQWLDSHGVEDYEVKDNLEIIVFEDVNLVGQDFEVLPEFIKFNIIYGGFYAGGNPWISLKGFPRVIHGDLQISSPSSPVKPGQVVLGYREAIIRKIIKVDGTIWI